MGELGRVTRPDGEGTDFCRPKGTFKGASPVRRTPMKSYSYSSGAAAYRGQIKAQGGGTMTVASLQGALMKQSRGREAGDGSVSGDTKSASSTTGDSMTADSIRGQEKSPIQEYLGREASNPDLLDNSFASCITSITDNKTIASTLSMDASAASWNPSADRSVASSTMDATWAAGANRARRTDALIRRCNPGTVTAGNKKPTIQICGPDMTPIAKPTNTKPEKAKGKRLFGKKLPLRRNKSAPLDAMRATLTAEDRFSSAPAKSVDRPMAVTAENRFSSAPAKSLDAPMAAPRFLTRQNSNPLDDLESLASDDDAPESGTNINDHYDDPLGKPVLTENQSASLQSSLTEDNFLDNHLTSATPSHNTGLFDDKTITSAHSMDVSAVRRRADGLRRCAPGASPAGTKKVAVKMSDPDATPKEKLVDKEKDKGKGAKGKGKRLLGKLSPLRRNKSAPLDEMRATLIAGDRFSSGAPESTEPPSPPSLQRNSSVPLDDLESLASNEDAAPEIGTSTDPDNPLQKDVLNQHQSDSLGALHSSLMDDDDDFFQKFDSFDDKDFPAKSGMRRNNLGNLWDAFGIEEPATSNQNWRPAPVSYWGEQQRGPQPIISNISAEEVVDTFAAFEKVRRRPVRRINSSPKAAAAATQRSKGRMQDECDLEAAPKTTLLAAVQRHEARVNDRKDMGVIPIATTKKLVPAAQSAKAKVHARNERNKGGDECEDHLQQESDHNQVHKEDMAATWHFSASYNDCDAEDAAHAVRSMSIGSSATGNHMRRSRDHAPAVKRGGPRSPCRPRRVTSNSNPVGSGNMNEQTPNEESPLEARRRERRQRRVEEQEQPQAEEWPSDEKPSPPTASDELGESAQNDQGEEGEGDHISPSNVSEIQESTPLKKGSDRSLSPEARAKKSRRQIRSLGTSLPDLDRMGADTSELNNHKDDSTAGETSSRSETTEAVDKGRRSGKEVDRVRQRKSKSRLQADKSSTSLNKKKTRCSETRSHAEKVSSSARRNTSKSAESKRTHASMPTSEKRRSADRIHAHKSSANSQKKSTRVTRVSERTSDAEKAKKRSSKTEGKTHQEKKATSEERKDSRKIEGKSRRSNVHTKGEMDISESERSLGLSDLHTTESSHGSMGGGASHGSMIGGSNACRRSRGRPSCSSRSSGLDDSRSRNSKHRSKNEKHAEAEPETESKTEKPSAPQSGTRTSTFFRDSMQLDTVLENYNEDDFSEATPRVPKNKAPLERSPSVSSSIQSTADVSDSEEEFADDTLLVIRKKKAREPRGARHGGPPSGQSVERHSVSANDLRREPFLPDADGKGEQRYHVSDGALRYGGHGSGIPPFDPEAYYESQNSSFYGADSHYVLDPHHVRGQYRNMHGRHPQDMHGTAHVPHPDYYGWNGNVPGMREEGRFAPFFHHGPQPRRGSGSFFDDGRHLPRTGLPYGGHDLPNRPHVDPRGRMGYDARAPRRGSGPEPGRYRGGEPFYQAHEGMDSTAMVAAQPGVGQREGSIRGGGSIRGPIRRRHSIGSGHDRDAIMQEVAAALERERKTCQTCFRCDNVLVQCECIEPIIDISYHTHDTYNDSRHGLATDMGPLPRALGGRLTSSDSVPMPSLYDTFGISYAGGRRMMSRQDGELDNDMHTGHRPYFNHGPSRPLYGRPENWDVNDYVYTNADRLAGGRNRRGRSMGGLYADSRDNHGHRGGRRSFAVDDDSIRYPRRMSYGGSTSGRSSLFEGSVRSFAI